MELLDHLKSKPDIAIAFSGGADSAYLLYAALKAGCRVKAYYVKSPFQPEFELEDAKRLACELGCDMEIIEHDVLSDERIAGNGEDRCYHCKRAIFSAILAAAAKDGFELVADGSNASDDPSDRPGIRALQELKVCSPLRECGLTKSDVRRLSKEAGLFTHDKPAYACLATRTPTGCPITFESLRRTEAAETFLRELGMDDLRVRQTADGGARIQLRPADMETAVRNAGIIFDELKKYYGYAYLDLEARE